MNIIKITDHTEIYLNTAIYELMALAYYTPTQGKIKSAAESVYSKQQGKFYVAKIEDEIVAILGAKRIDNSRLELNHLAVKESFRGQGIAKKLVHEVLQIEGVPEMTAISDEHLIGFFKKSGFKVWGNPDESLGGVNYVCSLKR